MDSVDRNGARSLAGITVVEIGHSVAAPYAGMILAEFGARVIKVEPPGEGDYARQWGPPFHDGSAPHFLAINRNKASIAVDLSNGDAAGALRRLILAEADVVLCNLRAGTAEKRGLGAEALLAAKPSLVFCEIGAFGRGGPLSHKPGYDPLMQAYGGVMSVTGDGPERPPIRVGVSMIDMGSGLWAALGVMSALMARQASGRGGRVEASLYETALGWVTIPVARASIDGAPQLPQGSGAAGIVPYQAFRASDGWLVIAAGNDGLFAKLCRALDLPGLADDQRFLSNRGRVEHRAELIPQIEARVATRTVAGNARLLDEAGVPNAPVQTIDRVITDPQTAALGILQEGPAGSLATIGLPVRFDGERPAYARPAPRLGAETDAILGPYLRGERP